MATLKRTKVLPRRHVGSVAGLLHHSQRLHRVFAALDREEIRSLRRLSLTRVSLPTRRASGLHSAARSSEASRPAPTASSGVGAAVPAGKPLVFRKTKRELEREREHVAQQQQLSSALLVDCTRRSPAAKLRPSHRAEFLLDAHRLRIGGERGRSRRRLLF